MILHKIGFESISRSRIWSPSVCWWIDVQQFSVWKPLSSDF